MQKIIARAGIASRRHAEQLIRSGQVLVNGVVVTELGSKADPEHDRIEAAGRAVEQAAEAVYFVLNKPPHVVSTMADPEGRATLRHLLRGMAGGVFPVGGLDYAASGLIFLTSDGQLADALFKASPNLLQVYWVKLKGRPLAETLAKVGHKAQARLRLLRAPGAVEGRAENPWYEAELRGSRRDVLRQAFFEAGHPVEKIRRVRFGPLELSKLEEGAYRALAPGELAALRRAIEHVARGGEWGPERAAVRPAAQKRPWRPRVPTGPGRPARQGGGKGDRSRRGGPERFAPAAKGGPRRGTPGGEKRFQPGGPRPGGGFSRSGRKSSGEGDRRGGHRGKGQGFGRGKFAPPGARPGLSSSRGKFRGKRPPGVPGGRPQGRPPFRRGGRPNAPSGAKQ